ncbi:MAG: DUF488 domain-containing protein [Patescibacteria group bacterium]|nr:DUF488 domain-containing protein [Patescibacteria group bacterium]
MKRPRIYTIGHSTRTAAQFIALLKAHGVAELVDIRTIPRSRHNPQFNELKIAASLRRAHIGYCHLKELGGLRHTTKVSVNLGWRNKSFRGFADYMQTGEFADGLAQLMKIARKKRTAIMCAEAVPWRCHRSLVADALTKKKWMVLHIQSAKTARRHTLTPFLRVRKGMLVYPEA